MKEHGLTVYRDEECSPVLVVKLKTGKDGLEFVEDEAAKGDDDEMVLEE